MQPLDFNRQDESNHFPALVQAIRLHMDFKKWGFSYQVFPCGTLFDESSALIFQSEYCKLRVWTFRDIRDHESAVDYAYGRLHAPNDKHTIRLDAWGGREYTCWHNELYLYLVLGYLEGHSAQEMAQREFPYVPDALLKFREEAAGWGPQERFARQQNEIWNHYGQRLFEFYDLRTPGLWNRYVEFVKEFRALKEDQELPHENANSLYAAVYPVDLY